MLKESEDVVYEESNLNARVSGILNTILKALWLYDLVYDFSKAWTLGVFYQGCIEMSSLNVHYEEVCKVDGIYQFFLEQNWQIY